MDDDEQNAATTRDEPMTVEMFPPRYRQRMICGDGVPFLWPCPTRQALTGEAAPDPGTFALTAAPSKREGMVEVDNSFRAAMQPRRGTEGGVPE